MIHLGASPKGTGLKGVKTGALGWLTVSIYPAQVLAGSEPWEPLSGFLMLACPSKQYCPSVTVKEMKVPASFYNKARDPPGPALQVSIPEASPR